jgi:hypothetical protein
MDMIFDKVLPVFITCAFDPAPQGYSAINPPNPNPNLSKV